MDLPDGFYIPKEEFSPLINEMHLIKEMYKDRIHNYLNKSIAMKYGIKYPDCELIALTDPLVLGPVNCFT